MTSPSAVYADLHTHTQASDGVRTPSALVAAAAERGLEVLAVTDHDTVDGLAEAQRAADARGLQFLAGVELSVTLDQSEIHLLAYGVDPHHEALTSHLAAMRRAREDRAWRMMERLRAHGLRLPDEHLEAQVADTTAPGRPHVAAALVAAGHVDTVGEAFRTYIGRDGPGFVDKPAVAAEEVLSIVHAAGGVGVLAHPGDWISSRQIRALAQRGLDGLEIHHPSHRSSLTTYYRRLADGHDLLTTGGSDYHGRTEAEEESFGRVGMSKREWERFWAALA
jgi:hypothetical protein